MDELRVFLRADSFISVVAAVVEGFKLEVGGLLFGDRHLNKNEIIIKQAIPLQTTKRTPYSVHFHPKKTKRVKDIWDNLTTHWPVGSFHSHPESKDYVPIPEPSEADGEIIQEDEVELIVAIWEAKKRNRLEYTLDCTQISGAVGKYYIQLAVWYLDEEEEEIVAAELFCPYIDVINLGYETGLVQRAGGLFEPDTFVNPAVLQRLQKQIDRYEKKVYTDGEEEAEFILNEIEQILEQIREENEDLYYNEDEEYEDDEES